MKTSILKLALCASLLNPFISDASGVWQQVDASNAPQKLQLMHPKQFLVYIMDEATLKLQMWNLSTDPKEGMIVTLPLPNGTTRDFKVWETPVMPDELATKYPGIKTFTAEALGNSTVTAKLDFTLFGFHAMIYDGDNTSFIDPYDSYHDGFYMVHYKRDEVRPIEDRMKCLVHGNDENGPAGENMEMGQSGLPKLGYKTVNGYQLRTYRLALAADHFYCAAAPAASTIALALSKMTTSVNRISGVFERELSIHLTFAAAEDQIIWPTATGSSNGPDPFSTVNANASHCLDTNQKYCDLRVGPANYDIGHAFTTGAGGLSSLACVCQGIKAQSVTGSAAPVGDGFDIDYVIHEMGHEFSAEHPFNDPVNGSCGGGNINTPTAYEPGSGSTIMAYAGICNPDDLQAHSDAYFHRVSLMQIQSFITAGGDCAVKTPTGNKTVGYSSFNATYSIPYLTPFELIAPVLTDSVADTSTLYCWEEWDKGTGATFSNTHAIGPIFRSYNPTTSPIRIFPKPAMVLSGILSNAGVEDNQGEKVPDTTKDMVFQCTFRDIINNNGCFTFPDDNITLHAVTNSTFAGFAVTSQGTATTFTGGDAATVTWDVVGTNVAPVNATSVDIYLSLNCGNNFFIGTFPNTGTASITVPNPAVSSSEFRFKVKGSGNVFFNVNGANFTVNNNPSLPSLTNGIKTVNTDVSDIKVYPVPANNMLHIAANKEMNVLIINEIGQKVWEGKINGQMEIPVTNWTKGVYYIRFVDAAKGDQVVKPVIIE